MTKQYKLAAGINVGMKDTGSQEDNIKNYIYSASLLDFFDKNIKIKFDYMSTKYKKEYFQAGQTPEYENFLRYLEKNYGDKYGDIIYTPQVYEMAHNKKMEILGEKYQKIEKDYIQKLKKTWTPYVNLIKTSMQQAKNGKNKNKSIEIKDGKAVLNGDFLIHNIRFNENIEDYESRKELGILASEWFGKEEDRHEGFMCSFFIKENEIKPSKDDFLENDDTGCPIQAKHPCFTFILDASNPDLKKLMENDFFGYEKNKNNADYLKTKTPQQIEMFKHIEQNSRRGEKAATTNKDWVAIPGGVPSKFIVGIIAHNLKPDSPDMAMVEEISEIFDVPMFNSALEVVHLPEKKLSKNEVLKEQSKKTTIKTQTLGQEFGNKN